MIAVNKERYKKILKRYEELYNQNLRLKKEFNDIKKACQSIVKLVDSTLKSKKFNGK